MTDSADVRSIAAADTDPYETLGDRSVSMLRANVLALAIIPPVLAAALVPFGLLHGFGMLGRRGRG